ncbi:LOW QUALITY PROTEIN: hypothetical protein KUTeg_024505, partial [Tegillarca granosa]
MMGETFFSEVANQDTHGGHGTLTAAEFEYFMGSNKCTIRQQKIICIQNIQNNCVQSSWCRRFHCHESFQPPQSILKTVHTISVIRKKKSAGKQREDTVSQKRNAILKCTLGVGWEKARVNESKILLT